MRGDFVKEETDGKRAEKKFIKMMEKRGYDCVKTGKENDRLRHYDVITRNSKIKYDVKARKKVNRNDKNPTDKYTWIELKGITGHDGSVFGDADYFAFENGSGFIEIKREILIDFVYNRVVSNAIRKYGKNDYTNLHGKKLYKFHNRDERADLIIMVLTSDLKKLRNVNKNINRQIINNCLKFSRRYVSNKQHKELEELYEGNYEAEKYCFACNYDIKKKNEKISDPEKKFRESRLRISYINDKYNNYKVNALVFCTECGKFYKRIIFNNSGVVRWVDYGFDKKYIV